jgi:hypothetical protein
MKQSFKQFLVENGLVFANVTDDDKVTIFGHTEKDFVTPKPKKKTKKDNTGSKLNRYLQYTATVNGE